MRHYTCSIFGAGGNSRGSAYDSGNAYIMFSSEERKESFKKVRKHIKDSFKHYLSLNINCTNELRYYCNITCVTISKCHANMYYRIDYADKIWISSRRFSL